jgi:hypothetical protein
MENGMDQIGLKDIPIQGKADEALGLGEYGEALSEFIRTCDTPMTIALQGDWGSGKTSLMNLIGEDLLDTKYRTVFFNTWQYSQFDMADRLAISMMTRFVFDLAKKDSGLMDSAKNVAKMLAGIGLAAAKTAAAVAGQGDNLNLATNNVQAALAGDPGIADPAEVIAELKQKLQNMILELVDPNNGDTERVIFFIDDLDRLEPLKAVELLESLKVFLDLDHCVFVLACDYNVVTKGLKQKFSVGAAELNGKSFFDKIIQVPFQMPMYQYDVDMYYRSLLGKIGIAFSEEDLKLYTELTASSVGFNPRSLKRLLNSLLLLKIVGHRKGLLKKDDAADTREKERILFSILCLQESYGPIFGLIQKTENLDNFFDFLMSKDQPRGKKTNIEGRFEALKSDDNIHQALEAMEIVNDERSIERMLKFMKVFHRSIQLDSDKSKDADSDISEEELLNLKKLISLSNIVSAKGVDADEDEEVDPIKRKESREAIKYICQILNKKFENELNALHIGKFTKLQRNDWNYSLMSLDLFSHSGEKVEVGFNYTEDCCYGYLEPAGTKKAIDAFKKTYNSEFKALLEVNKEDGWDDEEESFNSHILYFKADSSVEGRRESALEIATTFFEKTLIVFQELDYDTRKQSGG